MLNSYKHKIMKTHIIKVTECLCVYLLPTKNDQKDAYFVLFNEYFCHFN